MASNLITEATDLLPYEWPGSYFFGDEEIESAMQVLKARSPFRFYGLDLQRCVERLEAAYCQRLQRKYAIAVNSGTAALSLALAALGVGPGDEVLVPGYMWISCISAIVRSGAIPRLVDVDDSFCMDPADLEKKIGPHSKGVLLVHMSGAMGAADQIAEICAKHNLFLLEDCAQANGATLKGRPAGTFGEMAIFSFQLNKNITAGEGGLVVCDDESLYRRSWAVHDLGYPRNADGRLEFSDPAYQMWGQGSRYAELLAAVMLAQLDKLDKIASAMRRNKYALKKRLSAIPGLSFRKIIDPDGDTGAFMLMIWKDRQTCLRMVEQTRNAGVRCGPSGLNNIAMTDWGLHIYFNNASLVRRSPLNAAGRPWSDPLNEFAKAYEYGKGTLPALDSLVDRSSLLAISPVLTGDAIERIALAFENAAKT
ncbi:MAG: aminotransferase class I/II-fold pyridoxal phosphate-dependent enzyme [Terracidiphilus sp.]|jgi:8-amino-3,8-dideoxy-alpha-D-manno-octulosonate transaminase